VAREIMKRYQLDPKNLPQLSKSDLARIDRMKDSDIDYSDIPPLGDEFFFKEAVITTIKKTYPFEEAESSPAEDETTDYGRYSPDCTPTGEDELYAIILDLVAEECATYEPRESFLETPKPRDLDRLDSWGPGAYARAIEELDAVGFVKMKQEEGRITATILPKARKFQAWMEYHDRRNRIQQARHELATVPGATAEVLARAYKITVDEITAPGA
jgi:hypothetical protein